MVFQDVNNTMNKLNILFKLYLQLLAVLNVTSGCSEWYSTMGEDLNPLTFLCLRVFSPDTLAFPSTVLT